MNHFFSLHAGVNSFTQVNIHAAEDERLLTGFKKTMLDQKITLKQEITDNASRFEFFEAVRTVLLLTKCPLDGPGGHDNPVLRFHSSATKNFPSGEVQDLKREDGQMKLYTHVIGLHGPTGVLPHHDRDMVSGGEPNILMRDFLDLFNSRAITLFFRGLALKSS